MELRHLRYFVTVADELHFGRAAERLFMAQPPLSQQIRQLEDEIGVRLFDRTSRRVTLTLAGAAFLEEARDILRRTEAAVQRARRVAKGEAGWLGVGFVGSATYDILPAILRIFRERYPDIELTLLELLGNEQGEALRDRRIHVGFARLPIFDESVVQEAVAREPIIAALPSDHPLARQAVLPLASLAGEPFILFPRPPQSSYADYIIQICQSVGFTPRVVQETGEIQTAVSLVAAGIGVALVPVAMQNLRRDGVIYRPLADPVPTIELTMSYRENDSSPVLPKFLEIARTVAESDPAAITRQQGPGRR